MHPRIAEMHVLSLVLMIVIFSKKGQESGCCPLCERSIEEVAMMQVFISKVEEVFSLQHDDDEAAALLEDLKSQVLSS